MTQILNRQASYNENPVAEWDPLKCQDQFNRGPTDSELAKLIPYWRFFRLRPFAVSGLVIAGLLGLVADLVGIGLILPLLSLMDGSVTGSVGLVSSRLPVIHESIAWLIAMPPQVRLFSIAVILLSLGLFRGCISYVKTYLASWTFANLSRDLHKLCYDRFLETPVTEVLLGDTSSFTNTIVSFPRETATVVLSIAQLVVSLVSVLVIVALVLVVSWKTGLVAVCLSALAGVLVWLLLIRRISGYGNEINDRGILFYGWIIESVRGRVAIDGLSMQDVAKRRLDMLAASLVSFTLLRDNLRALVDPALSLVGAALISALLLLAARDEANIVANLAESIILVMCLTRLMAPMSSLNVALSDLQTYKNSAERVSQFLDWRPEVRDEGREYPGLQRLIELKDVSYQYVGRTEPALTDVNFRIERQSMVALVGRSGAGKSTIVNLLMRFIEPSTGSILVDGVDLRSFSRMSWRKKIAYVPQDSFLFDETIENNIKSGLNVTIEEVLAAATKAHAADFISETPLGLSTRVGENGVRLSGGQKQRIALARAVLRRPDILILDEATSNLDSVSEHAIRQSLNELRRSCAVVVVAHRLSTIADSDLILVLDGGKIVEVGTHEELLARGGLYEQMWSLQRADENGEGGCDG